MRRLSLMILMLGTLLLPCPLGLAAEDMRARQVEAEQARRALLDKAASEKRTAGREAAESRARILEDRDALAKAVAALKQRTQ